MKNNFIRFLGICSLMLVVCTTAQADTLCVRNGVKVAKTGKVNLKTAFTIASTGENCPSGYTSLISPTDFFRENACTTETVTASSECAEGTTCTISAFCGQDGLTGGSVSGDALQSWAFDGGTNKNGVLVSSDFFKDGNYGYAIGVSITTRSLASTGGHSASLRLVCCNAY